MDMPKLHQNKDTSSKQVVRANDCLSKAGFSFGPSLPVSDTAAHVWFLTSVTWQVCHTPLLSML